MTVRLPLYIDAAHEASTLRDTLPLKRDPKCELCNLSKSRRDVCAPPEGEPGGLLVLDEHPKANGSAAARKIIRALWAGPVTYDYALRCEPRKALKTNQVDKVATACRPYTADVMQGGNFSRVIVYGSAGRKSLFGPGSACHQIRNGYQWLRYEGRDVPVFFMQRPSLAIMSSARIKRWKEDLAWALSVDPPKPPWQEVTTLVQTEAEAEDAVADLRAGGCVKFDVETYGDMYGEDFLVLCVSAGRIDSDHTYTWDTRGRSNPAVSPLLRLMADPAIAKGGQAVKYDINALAMYFGVDIEGKVLDTQLLHSLVDCTQDADLEASGDQVGCGGHKAEAKHYVDRAVTLIRKYRRKLQGETYEDRLQAVNARIRKAPPDGILTEDLDLFAHAVTSVHAHPKRYAYAFVPKAVLYRYCALDVLTTARVWRYLWRRLCTMPDVKLAWDELVQPVITTIARIERNGMMVERSTLEAFCKLLSAKEEQLLLKIDEFVREHCPDGINLNSNVQLQDLLFKKLGLPVVKDTATGAASTDAESLNELRGHHPFVPLLLEYKTIAKLQSSYGDGLQPHVQRDSRIHASFNITGARTGRMSCKEPNCFSGDTEVLTPQGWVKFAEIDPARLPKVAQWEDGRLSFVKPTGWVERKDAPLLELVQDNVNLAVTEDHRCLTYDIRKSGWQVHPAAEYPEYCRQYNGAIMKGRVRLSDDEVILLVALQVKAQFLHDGSVCMVREASRNITRVIDAAHRLGLKVRTNTLYPAGKYVYIDKVPSNVLRYLDMTLPVKPIRGRNWSWRTLELDTPTKVALLLELPRWLRGTLMQERRHDADVVQALAVCSDMRATVVEELQGFEVHVHRNPWTTVKRKLHRRELPKQDVFCVTVPSSYLLVRRDGCTAVTGNCQTIPSRGDYAKKIKNVFCAPIGYKLVSWDYSQLELRVAAMLSGDPVMCQVYKEGRDYHAETAAIIAPSAFGEVFTKADEKMWREDPTRAQLMDDIRRAAKAVNFGCIYQSGDETLAKQAKVTVAQAAKVRAALFGKLKVFDKWTKQQIANAKNKGYTSTAWNGKLARRRPLLDITMQGRSEYASLKRGNEERAAINSPIQGTASDFCMASLRAIEKRIQEEGWDAKIVMTVHDSIILEVADHILPVVVPVVSYLMTQWHTENDVPLVVDCQVGQTWGSMTDWHDEVTA